MKIKIHDREFQVEPGALIRFWEEVNLGKWEAESFATIARFLPSEGTLLDLGCHFGAMSLFAAAGGAKVIAVDPDPIVATEFKQNVALNPGLAERIRFLPIAVDHQDGIQPLYARAAYGLSSSSLTERSRDQISSANVRKVRLETLLNELDQPRIDLIKMDVEGSEFQLLPEFSNVLQSLGQPTVMVSFHYNFLLEHQFLKAFGGWKLLAKVMERAARSIGLDPMRRRNRRILLSAVQGMRAYRYVYDPYGRHIAWETLLADPFLTQHHELVFSNEIW